MSLKNAENRTGDTGVINHNISGDNNGADNNIRNNADVGVNGNNENKNTGSYKAKGGFFERVKNSAILAFLFGYERACDTFNRSGIKKVSRISRMSPSMAKLASSVSRFLYSNPVSVLLRKLKNTLLDTSCRTYGAFVFSFGFLTLLFYFSEMYFMSINGVSASMIFGASVSALGMLIMISDKPLYSAVEDGKILSRIFFGFFGLSRRQNEPGGRGANLMFACLAGILLAVAGFFWDPISVALLFVAALTVILSFNSPEFCMTLTLICLPFMSLSGHGTIFLVSLVSVLFISYILKVLRGRRTLRFEIHDFFVLLFGVCYLICGIFIGGMSSFTASLVGICSIFGYFVFSNLISGKRTAYCAVNAFIIPSVLVASLGIYQYYTDRSEFNWLDGRFEGLIDGRITSVFSNPNILAVYLLAVIVLCLPLARGDGGVGKRIFYFLIAALNTYALVLTWTRGAWVALLLAVLLMIAINFRHTPAILLLLIGFLPYCVYFLPEAVKVRLESVFDFTDSSISYRLSVWKSGLRIIADKPFFGIGIGSEAFLDNYPLYAISGTESAVHSHNLFLQVAIECGVVASVILLTSLLFVLALALFSGRYVKKSSVRFINEGALSAVGALLIYGATDYIWYNSQMMFLFWTLLGICVATCRCGKSEGEAKRFYKHEYDSFEIDIGIGRG